MTSPAALVNKVWNYAHVLRDDGVSYGDYVEQITCLLFLKMDQERHDHLGEVSRIPAEWRWVALRDKEGDPLELQYRHTLEALAREPGLLGTIFRKAQNKIQDPAKLRRLVVMIDGETWIGLDVDVKGEIYEGLLERNAQEVKSGAGQYFTPRPLIRAMVEVTDPAPGRTICDPACGTGGFLLAAYEHLKGKSEDFWQLILSTNLLGPFRCTKAAAEALRAARGAVVNVASIAGLTSLGSSIAYGASKAGVVNLTRNLARALAPEVRVNAVAPGHVETAWTAAWEDRRRDAAERALLKRNCQPEDIADAIVFLAAGGAMITGQTLVVDGGLTL